MQKLFLSLRTNHLYEGTLLVKYETNWAKRRENMLLDNRADVRYHLFGAYVPSIWPNLLTLHLESAFWERVWVNLIQFIFKPKSIADLFVELLTRWTDLLYTLYSACWVLKWTHRKYTGWSYDFFTHFYQRNQFTASIQNKF